MGTHARAGRWYARLAMSSTLPVSRHPAATTSRVLANLVVRSIFERSQPTNTHHPSPALVLINSTDFKMRFSKSIFFFALVALAAAQTTTTAEPDGDLRADGATSGKTVTFTPHPIPSFHRSLMT